MFANWFQFAPAESILNSYVQSRMLLWCRAGGGALRVNGEWFRLEPDQYLVLPWGHEILYQADVPDPFLVGGIHVVPNHAGNVPVEFTVAHAASDALAAVPWRRDVTGATAVVRGSLTWAKRLGLLATYIVDRFVEDPPSEKVMRDLAELLLVEVDSAIARRHAATVELPSGLRRMQVYIQEHLTERLNVAVVADVAGCSPATVHRLFRTHLGVTPHAFVAGLRMDQARRLLRTTRRPVSEIALHVGFDDPYHFSRAFKRATGMAPLHYRNANPPI